MKRIFPALFLSAACAAASAQEHIAGGVDLATSGTILASYGWAEGIETATTRTLRAEHYVYDMATYAQIGRSTFSVPCVQDAWGTAQCKWTHLLNAGGAYPRCYRAAVGVNLVNATGVVVAQNGFTSGMACPQPPPPKEPGCNAPGGPIETSIEPGPPGRAARGGPSRVAPDDVSAAPEEAEAPADPSIAGRPPIQTQGAKLCGSSPILIDVSGRDYELSGDPVAFDLDADGVAERTNWTAPRAGVGFLVLDRNGNGTIDDGTELFGDHTPLSTGERAPYGYIALAEYDLTVHGGNFDGFISPEDQVWQKLRLWIDRNHDGQSQPDELETLDQAGILKILSDYEISRKKDRFGNLFLAKGKAWTENRRGDPKEIPIWDVIFKKR
jgi:hypothetical protein